MAKSRSRSRRRNKIAARETRPDLTKQGVASKPAPVLLKARWQVTPKLLGGIALLLAAILFSYWPTISWMVNSWIQEPDYSHGFLVIPLAWLILQYRPEFPGVSPKLSFGAVSLFALAVLMRVFAYLNYAEFLDAWSMLPMIGGIVWLLLGRKAFLWSLPPLLFLLFMMPLPYRAESLLSWKLQGVATALSTTVLRVLGQPAVSEGHTIWVGGEQLFVERACSGLRIFVGVFALAFFWAAISNRSWLDRIVIIASALPLAIFANSVRITVMALLLPYCESDHAHHLVHDFTGLAMIPFAFFLLWLVKVFWEHAYKPVETMTARTSLNAATG
jgi:exosortase